MRISIGIKSKLRRFLPLLLALISPLSLSAEPQASSDAPNTAWLVTSDTAGQVTRASTITPYPSEFYRGDLVRFELVLSNTTESDQRLDVEVTLGLAAFFVDADHGGALAEPEEAPRTRGVVWRSLDLPANASGKLELTVVLRPDENAGDLAIDVAADDVFSAGEPLRLSFHRQLTYDPSIAYAGAPAWVYAIFFGMPASLLLFAVLHYSLGTRHTATRLSGRLAAAFGAALLGGLIGYGMIEGVVNSYFGATETTCVVLDRRADPESMPRTSTTAGSTATRIYERPLIAAEYEAAGFTQVAVGFSSDIVSSNIDDIDDFQLGDEVRCWYDNDWHDRFFVIRGFDFGALVLFGFTTLGSLGLLFLACRPWR